MASHHGTKKHDEHEHAAKGTHAKKHEEPVDEPVEEEAAPAKALLPSWPKAVADAHCFVEARFNDLVDLIIKSGRNTSEIQDSAQSVRTAIKALGDLVMPKTEG